MATNVSPATATDYSAQTGYIRINEDFYGEGDVDYFKIHVSDAINEVWMAGFGYYYTTLGILDTFNITLVDASDVEIVGSIREIIWTAPNYQYGAKYTNLPIGDYYVRVEGISLEPLPYKYTLAVEIWETQAVVDNPIRSTGVTFGSIDITNIDLVPFTPTTEVIIPGDPTFEFIQYFNTFSFDFHNNTSLVYGTWPRPRNLYVDIFKQVAQPLLANNYWSFHPMDGSVGNIPPSAVTKDGNPTVGNLIRLYDRVSGELIDETYTDAAGDYTFPSGLMVGDKYFIIAFDDVATPALEAKIHDFLDPVVKTYAL